MLGMKKSRSSEYNPDALSPSHNPTPLEFDRFIPWVLMAADIVDKIRVNKLIPNEEISRTAKRLQSSRAFSGRVFSQMDVSRINTETYTKASADSLNTNSGSSTSSAGKVTIITAIYTGKGQLTEVAFINLQQPVPRIVLDAIHVCLPYHPELTRITWKGGYLTGALISAISKMLMDSFLTDVVLDNSCVPERNYYILLDGVNLKYLSLRCCGVDDDTCEKIAERMQRCRPGQNLVALNLGVNCITDRGAKALGHALRTNRRLSFLNLCCNCITGDGAAHILLPLTKFPLNPDEVRETKKTRWELAKQKIEADKIYLGDITNLDKKHRKEKRKTFKQLMIKENENTEKSTQSEGADDDIFMSSLELCSGVWFSLGNLTLCSLNLAFNQLDSMSVSKIADVLSYQYNNNMGPKSGLMRVVIEGNLLPKDSPKYHLIDKYMSKALYIPPDVPEHGKTARSLHNVHKSKSKFN